MKFNLLKGVGVMSLRNKSRINKVVLSAAAVIAVVVGIVVAQVGPTASDRSPVPEYPYKASVTENVVADGEFSTQHLTLEVVVDNHAALWAIGRADAWLGGDASKAARIDTVTCINPLGTACPDVEGIVGNAGVLLVETNLAKWDILVNAKNGGYLKRDTRTDRGEVDDAPVAPRTPIGYARCAITLPNGDFEEVAPIQVPNTNPWIGGMMDACPPEADAGPLTAGVSGDGYELYGPAEGGKYLKGGPNNAPVPLRIGVGTIIVGTAGSTTIAEVGPKLQGFVDAASTAYGTTVESFAYLDSVTYVPNAWVVDNKTSAGFRTDADGTTVNNIASVAKELDRKSTRLNSSHI
jgi:hypothetical protein